MLVLLFPSAVGCWGSGRGPTPPGHRPVPPVRDRATQDQDQPGEGKAEGEETETVL